MYGMLIYQPIDVMNDIILINKFNKKIVFIALQFIQTQLIRGFDNI
jgi:hypothetical protein